MSGHYRLNSLRISSSDVTSGNRPWVVTRDDAGATGVPSERADFTTDAVAGCDDASVALTFMTVSPEASFLDSCPVAGTSPRNRRSLPLIINGETNPISFSSVQSSLFSTSRNMAMPMIRARSCFSLLSRLLCSCSICLIWASRSAFFCCKSASRCVKDFPAMIAQNDDVVMGSS